MPRCSPSRHPRTAEYALLRAAHAAGVAVPAPLFCCTAREVTGAPFFVMQRVEGIAAGHRLVRAAQGTALAEALGRELARIHSIVPPRADLPFLGDPPADAHAAFIAAQRAALDAAGTPRPVLEWGLRHLERTAPPAGRDRAEPQRLPHRQLHGVGRPGLGDPRLGIRRLGRPARRPRLVLRALLALRRAGAASRRHRPPRRLLRGLRGRQRPRRAA